MTELRKMRTAEEMYEYYCEMEKGKGSFLEKWVLDEPLQPYKSAESLLEPDEYCLTIFSAYIYIYAHMESDERYMYFLTNKRIITVGMYCDGIESIRWEKIGDMTVEEKSIIIEVDTYYMSLSRIFVKSNQLAEIIKKELEKVMPFIWEEREKMLQERNRFLSPADEIRKFKQLWDDGIITEEEFQQKKKKLLDL